MSTIIWIVILIVALAAGIGAGYFIGYNNRKKTAEAQIGSAEAEATRLVNEAIKTAEQKRKEAVLEAKDEAFKLKAEVDAQKLSLIHIWVWISCCWQTRTSTM